MILEKQQKKTQNKKPTHLAKKLFVDTRLRLNIIIC